MPPTLLIVDDDVVTVEQYRRMLALEGYRVLTAHSAAEGMALVWSERPDLIVLDLHMPVLDGADMLKELRAVEPLREVPVVIVTGDYLIDERLSEQLRRSGSDLVFKPLWLDDLVSLVSTRLHQQRSTVP